MTNSLTSPHVSNIIANSSYNVTSAGTTVTTPIAANNAAIPGVVTNLGNGGFSASYGCTGVSASYGCTGGIAGNYANSNHSYGPIGPSYPVYQPPGGLSGQWISPNTYSYPNIITAPNTGYHPTWQQNISYDFDATPNLSKYIGNNFLTQFLDADQLKVLCKEKNYMMICQSADHALKIDREIFIEMEKVIKNSKDFSIIALYMRSVKNCSIKHLTKNLIDAYEKSEKDNDIKSIELQSFLIESHGATDLKYLINYAIKRSLPEYIEWMVGYSYRSDFSRGQLLKLLENVKIDFADIEALMLKTKHIENIFFFALTFEMSNKKHCFDAIRSSGNEGLIDRFINEIDDPYTEGLRNMK